MSGHHLRFTEVAQADLLALFQALLTRDPDQAVAAGLDALREALRVLEHTPASGRPVTGGPPHGPLRELPIPLGPHGCVALYAIEDEATVTVLALRAEPAPTH